MCKTVTELTDIMMSGIRYDRIKDLKFDLISLLFLISYCCRAYLFLLGFAMVMYIVLTEKAAIRKKKPF